MKKMLFAQSCDSLECKKKFKDQINKKLCEAITTVHELNYETGEIKCMECGKITKLEKSK